MKKIFSFGCIGESKHGPTTFRWSFQIFHARALVSVVHEFKHPEAVLWDLPVDAVVGHTDILQLVVSLYHA